MVFLGGGGQITLNSIQMSSLWNYEKLKERKKLNKVYEKDKIMTCISVFMVKTEKDSFRLNYFTLAIGKLPTWLTIMSGWITHCQKLENLITLKPTKAS